MEADGENDAGREYVEVDESLSLLKDFMNQYEYLAGKMPEMVEEMQQSVRSEKTEKYDLGYRSLESSLAAVAIDTIETAKKIVLLSYKHFYTGKPYVEIVHGVVRKEGEVPSVLTVSMEDLIENFQYLCRQRNEVVHGLRQATEGFLDMVMNSTNRFIKLSQYVLICNTYFLEKQQNFDSKER